MASAPTKNAYNHIINKYDKLRKKSFHGVLANTIHAKAESLCNPYGGGYQEIIHTQQQQCIIHPIFFKIVN
jgi:hypothetical protein